MPAVEVAIVLPGVESGLRFTADQADVPLFIEPPVGAHDQTLSGVFERAVELAVDLAAMAERLNPHPPGIRAAGGLTR
ncbi:hypothetical protein PS624_04616 [Pseudomonas fluorescens]|uniref:Uncharacterized protein n=1 Tax=Pseudomonas fluorescens TaxID=294 RepID=A0A5E6WDH2_PSEFL|nr:hypothetical protein PS624_04616 [Pseudomonas fluorescens]